MDYIIIILLFLNLVLTAFAISAAQRAADKRVVDAVVVEKTSARFDQIDRVLERIDRASVGTALTAQQVAVDLDSDRILTKGVASDLAKTIATAKDVPEGTAPGTAADAYSRGPSDA